MFRINVQHYSCDFAPISTFRIRVEQAQIRDDVLLVVDGQDGIGGVRYRRHRDRAAASARGLFSKLLDRSNLPLGLGILMTAKP